MKKALTIIVLIMIIQAMLSVGQFRTTKDWFSELSSLLRQKDYIAADSFIIFGRGGILKADSKVYVMDMTRTGLVKIHPVGKIGTVWTIREAIVE